MGRALVALVLAPAVHGQYVCNSPLKAIDGAKCSGAESSSCTEQACCAKQKTCSNYAAAWLLAQAGGGGCRAGNAKLFWDTKKVNEVVAQPLGDAEKKAACCTKFSDAKCSDWPMGGCGFGFKFKAGAAAPPDGSDGLTLSSSKYKELCCEELPNPPTTCSKFAVTWITAQLLSGGCMKGGKKMFFDRKKDDVEVASPAGETEVTDACCTKFSDAKCSDWPKGGCGLGYNFKESASAPADGSDGKTLSDSKYKELCCEEIPKTCGNYMLTWIANQGQYCAKDGAKKFFDRKKTDVIVSPATTDKVRSTCCTEYKDAKCGDWVKVCKANSFLLSSQAAPADNGGTTLSQESFQKKCCGQPLACEDYTSASDVDMAQGRVLNILTIAAVLRVFLS